MCSFFTFNILQFYYFYFRVPPLTSDIKRHMRILKLSMVSFMISLIRGKASSTHIVAVHSRMYSNSNWSWGSHSSDRLAVSWCGRARGSERWASDVLRTSSITRAVPIIRARMPISRSFKSISAWPVGGWPESFPFGLLILMPCLLRSMFMVCLLSWLMISCIWLENLKMKKELSLWIRCWKQIATLSSWDSFMASHRRFFSAILAFFTI